MMATEVVDIQPESDILATYRRLSYHPWYAIAEFVDNATWNFQVFKDKIAEQAVDPPVLQIDIYYERDEGTLTVVDNAHGMDLEEFKRAMQLAKPPKDVSGRSEFGMGLKTAACWLGPRWRVVSSQLGEPLEFSCEVDLEMFTADRPKSLNIGVVGNIDPSSHYTRIEVRDLHLYDRVFVGRTLGKIKSEIASIYRRDLTSGEVKIRFNGDDLVWDEPPLLEERNGETTDVWRKQIDFEIQGKRVQGWIGLLANGRAADAGFHIFRRGRIIRGGPSRGWKPWEVFRAPNSFASQRLVGELDFDAWHVSHTKDQLDMSGADEHELIDKLVELSLDYLAKARESRKEGGGSTLSRAAAESIVEGSKGDLEESDELGAALAVIEEGVVPSDDPDETLQVEAVKEEIGEAVELRFGGVTYPVLSLVLSDASDPTEPLARVGFPADNRVTLVLNLQHPFIANYVADSEEAMKLLVHTLYADVLVERIQRKSPALSAAQLRLVKDSLLRNMRGGPPN